MVRLIIAIGTSAAISADGLVRRSCECEDKKSGRRHIALVDARKDEKYRDVLCTKGAAAITDICTGARFTTCSHMQKEIRELTQRWPNLEHRCLDWNDTVQQMLMSQQNNPNCIDDIIACHEPSVELADQLADDLQLDTRNSIGLSAARREKFLMQETIRKSGLASIKSILAKSSDEALEKMSRRHQGFPVVIKPNRGLASIAVSICHDKKELEAAFEQWIGHQIARGGLGALEGPIESLVVQEVIEGTEFEVNCVSHGGRRVVTDMWIKETEQSDRVYRSLRLVQSSAEHVNVVEYVFQVLNALGIHHGSSHAEVILTADGPCLVEVGARPSGGMDREIGSVPRGHWEYLAEAYTQPQEFAERPMHYLAKRHLATFFVVVPDLPVAERTLNMRALASIPSLASFVQFDKCFGLPNPPPVYPAVAELRKNASGLPRYVIPPKTSDLFSSPAVITLAHEDPLQLEADSEAIRRLEQNVMFSDPESEKCKTCRELISQLRELNERGSALPWETVAGAQCQLECDYTNWSRWTSPDGYYGT
jgi:hypothetical protein